MIELTSILVHDYDEAVRFFVDALDFELVTDSPALTTDGRAKRWVVVRPRGAPGGLLLAKADGPQQEELVGHQFAGRVGLFLRVDNFEAARQRMLDHGVMFETEPRIEPYGRVAVFLDIAGNRWDLLETAHTPPSAAGPAAATTSKATARPALTFARFAAMNSSRRAGWHGPGSSWTGADYSNEMCGEVGEAANVVKKLRRIETGTSRGQDATPEGLTAQLGEELADVIICAHLVADHYGIDIEQALVDKFNAISEKHDFQERLP